ncbi:MAG: hypothetical protein J5684_05795, partial [Eubacterium sp.]|nr:hypothetical protein [Eubacterium sp.]
GKTKSRYVKKDEREDLLKLFEKKNELKKLYNETVDKMLDDYNEVYYVSDIEKPYYQSSNIINEQLISLKENIGIYSVERNYVNSKKYHDIFASLPLSHEVQESLYKEAGRLLEEVDGKCEEHMIAVSSRTGKLITDNLNRTGIDNHTSFNQKEYDKIIKCEESIIVLHNHSSNGRPSARDIISYANDDKIRLSLILCHTGIVYAICNANKNVELIYMDLLEREKERWTDIEIAKVYATNDLYKINDKLGKNQKLFDIRRF